MFSAFIGNFDWPATFVVIGISVAIAIAVSTWLARTPPRLQQMKLQNERDIALATVQSNRDVNMAKMEQNLITSHKREE